jgi:hypothetical protein
MPVPQELQEVNQTTTGNLICYFFAILTPILIVSITTGITIKIAITMTM